MGDVRAGGRAGQRGPARVGKEVQHPGRTAPRARAADALLHEGPVGRLLREQPRMLEARGLYIEFQIVQADDPALRQLFAELPVSAAGVAAHIGGLRRVPQGGVGLGPDHLRVRTAQHDVAPALQLFAVAGVQHLIIAPLIAKKHVIRSSSSVGEKGGGIAPPPSRIYALRTLRTAFLPLRSHSCETAPSGAALRAKVVASTLCMMKSRPASMAAASSSPAS